MKRPGVWLTALAIVAIVLATASGAFRRNWAYLRLVHGDTAAWRQATATVVPGSRTDDLTVLRRAVAASDWSLTRQMLGRHRGDQDRLVPMIVLRDAERRSQAGDLAGAGAALTAVTSESAGDAAWWYRVGAAAERAHLSSEAVEAYELGSTEDAASPWSEGRYRTAMIYQREARWLPLVEWLAPQFRLASDGELELPIDAGHPGAGVWHGTFLALGEAYEHLGRTADAEATYERLGRIENPRRDWTLNRGLVYLSRAKRAHHDFETALHASVRAVDLATELDDGYRRTFELDTAGEADQLVSQVRQSGGLYHFEKSTADLTRRRPQSPGAWFLQGLTREAMCDKDGARSAYQRASQLVPSGAGSFLTGRPVDPPKGPCARL